MKKKSSFNSAFTPRLQAAYTKMESQKEDEEDGKNARSRTNRVSSEEGSEDGRREEVAGCCGEGRVWIFLVLGILTLVFSAVLIGIYMNVRSLTSSMDVIEVMPSFVPAASGGLAGLSLLLLFWKRHKVLVYPVLLLCAVCTVLCVIIAVLTGTHVLQPMLSLSTCVYTRKGNICQCLTQFRRDKLELEKAKDGEVVYLTLHDVSSCEDVEDVIPTMLFTMTGIHGLLAIVSTVAGIISFLVYRTERSRKYLEEVDYDDSPPSTPSTNSDNYAEHHTMLPSQPATSSNATTLVNIYTNTNATTTDDDPTNDDGNTTPSDVIYSPADVPMGYAEACRMRRCQSFSQPRRTLRESSPGSSASSQTASSLLSSDKNTSGAEGGGGIRLKEHRKKGRRAVTLHGLDREQLMLILSLQMRYLQESEQSAKKDNKLAADVVGNNVNQIPKTNAGVVSDSSDSSVVFTQLQRRAMTPTPRQERLSSSRTTDDDLDYRPVNLVRSHTPQPYHFKNQQHLAALPPTLSQYQLLQLQQQQLLQLQQQQYFLQQQKEIQIQQQQIQQQQLQKQQQQVQQPQLQQHLQQPAHQVDNINEDSDEQPTRITYDLRNVLKTGPIVYENVPSSRASLNYYSPDGSVSSNSSSLIRATNFPIQSGLSPPMQARPLPTPPQSTVTTTSGKLPAAGTAQTSANAQSQAHHQVPETSAQHCSETLTSDGKQPGKSKESTPEVQTPKTKSKKKLSKKEKNAKKDEEKPAEAVKPTTLGRTDSNTSKTGPVPDRWQTLMADGTTQAQTLWENVQRKVVSDPQTPDSTLTFPHSSRSSTAAQSANQSLSQGNATPQVIPNGILKNSKSKPYPNYPTQAIVAPQFFGPANQSLQPPYPNPNPVPKSQLFSHHPNEFVPIANSSTDNYEDIEDGYPVGQSNFLIPNEPPPKPARLHARNSSKMGSTAASSATVDSQGQQLRPKSYLSAVDKEIMANGNLNNLSGFSRPNAQGAEVQSLTHLQMEGPVRDDRNAILSGPPTDNGEQFMLVNGDLYSQPRRKSNPNTGPTLNGAPRIYQNTQAGHSGIQPMYRNQYPQGGAHSPQRSAFHTLGHAPVKDLTNPLSMSEACDTDLDDLPAPRWQRRYLRSQSFSPPPYAAPPLYQSLESVNRHSSVRSGSSSSSDPHNSSSDSSTAPKDNMHGAFRGQGQARGRQQAHLTDRRFCITHQRQLQQNLYNAQQQQLQDCPYEEDPGGGVHDAPYMIMRRCQSVEEGNRKRLPQRNGGQISHDIRNLHPQVDGRFYQNTEPLGYTKTAGLLKYSQYGDTNLMAAVRGKQSQNGNVIGGNVGRPTFQNGAQGFQKDIYARTNTGQARLQQANVVEEDMNSNSDNGSNIIEPLTRLGGHANEIVGYVGAVRLTESSDSDKDEYAETVI